MTKQNLTDYRVQLIEAVEVERTGAHLSYMEHAWNMIEIIDLSTALGLNAQASRFQEKLRSLILSKRDLALDDRVIAALLGIGLAEINREGAEGVLVLLGDKEKTQVPISGELLNDNDELLHIHTINSQILQKLDYCAGSRGGNKGLVEVSNLIADYPISYASVLRDECGDTQSPLGDQRIFKGLFGIGMLSYVLLKKTGKEFKNALDELTSLTELYPEYDGFSASIRSLSITSDFLSTGLRSKVLSATNYIRLSNSHKCLIGAVEALLRGDVLVAESDIVQLRREMRRPLPPFDLVPTELVDFLESMKYLLASDARHYWNPNFQGAKLSKSTLNSMAVTEIGSNAFTAWFSLLNDHFLENLNICHEVLSLSSTELSAISSERLHEISEDLKIRLKYVYGSFGSLNLTFLALSLAEVRVNSVVNPLSAAKRAEAIVQLFETLEFVDSGLANSLEEYAAETYRLAGQDAKSLDRFISLHSKLRSNAETDVSALVILRGIILAHVNLERFNENADEWVICAERILLEVPSCENEVEADLLRICAEYWNAAGEFERSLAAIEIALENEGITFEVKVSLLLLKLDSATKAGMHPSIVETRRLLSEIHGRNSKYYEYVVGDLN